MPIHDWSRVDPGIFHDFHQAWTIEIRNALNGGGLPPDFFAMTEQIVSGAIPDVVTLKRRGISLLVVDVFPPSPRDPQGIHKAIWDAIREEPFELPADKPLTVAAYCAGLPQTAYVEPVAVGDPLPGLPIFLDPGTYVPAPLEASYEATWAKCPDALREVVENPSR